MTTEPIAAWISTRGVTLQYGGQDEPKMRSLGWEPLFRRPAPKPKRERYIARFVPQAWVRDNAIECDAEGPDEWDCTTAFTALPFAYRSPWLAEMAADGEALDVDDMLKGDPDAPEWVRDWHGPFSIWVRADDTVSWDRPLAERRTMFIYEAARLQAWAVDAPVVPEPWDERDNIFRNQMTDYVQTLCTADTLPTPEAAHDSWWQKYVEMGWTYGPERDVVAKTHPDMVPFAELEQREQDKDAVFLALVEIARDWITDHD